MGETAKAANDWGTAISHFITVVGFPAFVAIYFMAKDWKLGQRLIKVMENISVNIARVNDKLHVRAEDEER